MNIAENPAAVDRFLAGFNKLPPARQQDMLTWGRWMVDGPKKPERAEFYRRFGARIRAFRIYMGYRNPDDFARLIKFKPSIYRPYEEGKRSQTAAINRLIVAIAPLGISLDWLFLDGSRGPMVHGHEPPHIQRRNAFHVIDGGAS